jgi:lysozyme family protein
MANIVSAIVYVLHQEDARMTGIVSNDPRDKGGRTRWGIAERFHRDLTPTGFFDSMSRDESLTKATTVYGNDYGAPLMLARIGMQQVANALLSFAINEGVISSIKVLQSALNLDQDGKFGDITLEAVNSMSNILVLLEAKQVSHYDAIVAADPTQQRFINGWHNRIKQDCESA